MRTRFIGGAIALVLALAGGALGSHVLAERLAIPPRALAQPLLVVTAWGGDGFAAWLLLAATMCGAGIAYAFMLHAIHRSGDDGAPMRIAVVVTCAAGAAAVLGFRFIFSSDVYAYAAYGALAALGQDPYRAHAPFLVPLLGPAFTSAVRYEWASLPACVYGPAFVWLSREVFVAAHGDIARALDAFRAIGVAAFVASVALIAAFAPRRPALIAATVGLNPIAIWTLAEGHNDTLAFLIAAGGALLSRAAPGFGGFVAGASTSIKASGGLATIFAAYPLDDRRFTRGAIAAIAASVALQIVAIALSGGYQVQGSTHFPGTFAAHAAVALKCILSMIPAVIAFHHVKTGSRSRALAAAALVIWALAPHPYAWYGLWLLPLAALTLESAEGKALLAATFFGLLRYIADAVGDAAAAAPWLGLLGAAIPILVLAGPTLARAWRERPAEKTAAT